MYASVCTGGRRCMHSSMGEGVQELGVRRGWRGGGKGFGMCGLGGMGFIFLGCERGFWVGRGNGRGLTRINADWGRGWGAESFGNGVGTDGRRWG